MTRVMTPFVSLETSGDSSIFASGDAIPGFGPFPRAFVILLFLRLADADFSLRTSALRSLNSFFKDLIFLSFFDIA